jgi:MOSC domain-containing protein YiiM
MEHVSAEIVQLLVSPVHRYEGRPADGPAPETPDELRDHVDVRAFLGIVGDRYYNKPAHRDAAVTFVAAEAVASLPGPPDLHALRRNVLLRGVDVDALVGHVLTLDSGDGPVRFRVHRRANPCRWMDVVIGAGSWQAMRGHGGVRSTPLDDGVLRLGPVAVSVD